MRKERRKGSEEDGGKVAEMKEESEQRRKDAREQRKKKEGGEKERGKGARKERRKGSEKERGKGTENNFLQSSKDKLMLSFISSRHCQEIRC